jgi:hypothetical protein
MKIRTILPSILLAAICCSFHSEDTLSGIWEYNGGIYNGKAETASKDYKLQRKYDAVHYTGMFIEKGEDTLTYEKGDYKLLPDTCLETQTFSSQPSQVTGVTLRYRYRISNDSLIFKGKLPNGTNVEEYWKKVK